MSRLRWPDSTNSVSDVPGTIHIDEKIRGMGAYKDLPSGLSTQPGHHLRNVADHLGMK